MTPLENYLRYYDTLSGPEYAVLVTGEWGVGKTYQVRDVLRKIDLERPGNDPLNPANYAYISLFGACTSEQIDAEVLAAISPQASALSWLAKSAREIASVLPAKAASVSLASFLAGPIMRNAIANAAHRTLVFDDLERSALDPKSLLGIINRYVEQLKFRVVVIAHDDKLFGTFTESKEKIFGQTFRVVADTEAAWPAFINTLKAPEKRSFVEKHKSIILKSFATTDVKSLRVLRHVIEDIGRLHDVLTEHMRANDKGCLSLVEWFAPADALVRVGAFKRDMLHRAAGYSMNLYNKKQTENYKPNNIENLLAQLLSDSYRLNFSGSDAAVSMLFDGNFDKDSIVERLRESAIFFIPSSQPSWQIAWHYFELDCEDFFKALDDMEKQFLAGNYEKTEEILHVFALRLRFSNDNLLAGRSIKEVERECVSYINALAAQGRIPENANSGGFTLDSLTGAYGLGYSVGDEGAVRDSFERLIAHYRETMTRVNEDGLASKAAALLDKLPSAPDEFIELLSDESYSRFPVFKAIDPKAFIEKAMETPTSHWRAVERAFNSRLEGNHDLRRAEARTLVAIFENIDRSYNKLVKSADRTETFKGSRIRWLFGSRLREQVADIIATKPTRDAATKQKGRRKLSSQ